MPFEFLHCSQDKSTNSAIQADPSAVPAHFEADVLVIFFESDGIRGSLVELDEATGGLLQQLHQQLQAADANCVWARTGTVH